MARSWLALLVSFALSPTLVETARHLAEEPWKLPAALLVPLLLVPLVRAERAETTGLAPLRGSGVAVMGLAVVLELLALAAGLPAWARLSLPLAAFGWLRAYSLLSLPSAALIFLALPPPTFASRVTSPWLEELWCRGAAALLPGVDAETFPVPIHPGDGGIAMLMLGAALGGWAARRFGRGGATVAIWACVGAGVGLACQGPGFLVAGVVGARIAPEMARHFLDLGPGLGLATAVVVAVSRQQPIPAPLQPKASS